MSFNSYEYLIFLPIVLLLFLAVPGKVRAWLLLFASYFFYMCWQPLYIFLILFATVSTYVGGLLIEKNDSNIKIKRITAFSSIGVNLLLLFFFKYFYFALDNINRVLSKLNMGQVNVRLNILLPVGISFYIFQVISYVADVYKGKIKAERSFIMYGLYVAFFPQLVAGPIERSDRIISQLRLLENKTRRELINVERMSLGVFIIIWGVFLKLVIADRISIFVDQIFNNYQGYGTTVLIAGAVAFAIQIYCDFSAYSLIAIGSARLFGIGLMQNFNTPYFSVSIKDFWRRWHISLSSWLRDYVYIPLGGSRCSRPRKYLNIFITFMLSGLWHGASWTFVIWGILHGMYQIIEDLVTPVFDKLNYAVGTRTQSFSYKLWRVFSSFCLVTFAWIFFRAQTVSEAFGYIKNMFTAFDPWSFTDGTLYTLGLNYTQMHILWLALIMLIIVSTWQRIKGECIDVLLSRQCLWFQLLYVFGMIYFISIYGVYGLSEELNSFIYFAF